MLPLGVPATVDDPGVLVRATPLAAPKFPVPGVAAVLPPVTLLENLENMAEGNSSAEGRVLSDRGLGSLRGQTLLFLDF